MKNILFLILICIIKLNAYQYLFCESIREDNRPTYARYLWYSDPSGLLVIREAMNGTISTLSADSYSNLYYSRQKTRTSTHQYYSITEYLKSDPKFLNDFYIQFTNQILNYFYNKNLFNNQQYVSYEDYELLYNSDGLAVESIVNGEWAGLYSESEKSSSGYLYDSGGTLIYYNGEKVSWIQSAIDKIIHHVIDNLHTLIHIISTPVGVCVSVVFVLCLAYYVVEVGRRAIKPIDDNIRKRNLNE